MLRNLTQKSLNSDKIPSNFFCTLFAGYDVYSPSLTSPKYHIHWWTEAPYYQTQRAYLLPGLGPLNRKRKIEQVKTQGKDPKNQNTTRSFASFLPSTWPDCPSHHCRKDDGIKVHRKKKKAKTRKALRHSHLSIILGILLLAISSFAAANFFYPESSVSTGAVFFLLSIAGCNWLKHLEKLVGYVLIIPIILLFFLILTTALCLNLGLLGIPLFIAVIAAWFSGQYKKNRKILIRRVTTKFFLTPYKSFTIEEKTKDFGNFSFTLFPVIFSILIGTSMWSAPMIGIFAAFDGDPKSMFMAPFLFNLVPPLIAVNFLSGFSLVGRGLAHLKSSLSNVWRQWIAVVYGVRRLMKKLSLHIVLLAFLFFPQHLHAEEARALELTIVSGNDHSIEESFKKEILVQLTSNDIALRKAATKKLYILINRDINDDINPQGWSIALAHVNGFHIPAIVELLDKKYQPTEKMLELLAPLILQHGFLNHLSSIHMSRGDEQQIQNAAKSIVETFVSKNFK